MGATPRRANEKANEMLTILPELGVGAICLATGFLVMSGVAMLIAILASLLYGASFTISGTSLVIDAGLGMLGFLLGKIWKASLLPMLAVYNGIGGAACVLGAVVMFGDGIEGPTRLLVILIATGIGGASIGGSLMAWMKLDRLETQPLPAWGRQATTLLGIAIILAVGSAILLATRGGFDQRVANSGLVFALLGCATLIGGLTTLLIDAANMPIVISIYNALIGLVIGLEGFTIASQAVTIAGITIGTARVLVTLLMVHAHPHKHPITQQSGAR
jgi:NAD(P) transhydrogenase subunit beta